MQVAFFGRYVSTKANKPLQSFLSGVYAKSVIINVFITDSILYKSKNAEVRTYFSNTANCNEFETDAICNISYTQNKL